MRGQIMNVTRAKMTDGRDTDCSSSISFLSGIRRTGYVGNVHPERRHGSVTAQGLRSQRNCRVFAD